MPQKPPAPPMAIQPQKSNFSAFTASIQGIPIEKGNKPPSLQFYNSENEYGVRIYTNHGPDEVNNKGVIEFTLPRAGFNLILKEIEKIAYDDTFNDFKFERKDYIFYRDKQTGKNRRSDEKVIVGTIVVHRAQNGIVYLIISSTERRPTCKFPLVFPELADVSYLADDPAQKNSLMRDCAASHAEWLRTHGPLLVATYYQTSYDRKREAMRNENGGNGGYNRQGGNGYNNQRQGGYSTSKPPAPSSSQSLEDELFADLPG